jgi:hypothetical protein
MRMHASGYLNLKTVREAVGGTPPVLAKLAVTACAAFMVTARFVLVPVRLPVQLVNTQPVLAMAVAVNPAPASYHPPEAGATVPAPPGLTVTVHRCCVFHVHVSTAWFVTVITQLVALPVNGAFPVITQPVHTYCVPPTVSVSVTVFVTAVPWL